ncbi:MAG: hypothetical protein U5L11_01145 [Arhodomonas sp.]|nr:hypothetical protein [Arhodomonas sp.]
MIGPLAFRRLVPPLGNQCIISLKDTSLFIVIGVAELTRQGQEVMASTFRRGGDLVHRRRALPRHDPDHDRNPARRRETDEDPMSMVEFEQRHQGLW